MLLRIACDPQIVNQGKLTSAAKVAKKSAINDLLPAQEPSIITTSFDRKYIRYAQDYVMYPDLDSLKAAKTVRVRDRSYIDG